jgi:hypothetical protein
MPRSVSEATPPSGDFRVVNRLYPDKKPRNPVLQSICEVIHKSTGFSLPLGKR